MKDKYTEAMKKVRFSKTFDEKTLDKMIKEQSRKKKPFRWDMFAAAAAAVVILAIAAVLTVMVMRKPAELPAEATENPAPQFTAENEEVVEDAAPAEKGGVVSTLLLSINPEIEFQLDEEGLIAAVIGINADGTELLEGTELVGYTFENAATVVMNKLLDAGYITSNEIAETITLKLGGENKNQELIEEMSGIIISAAERYEIGIETEQTAEDTLQLALKKEIVEEAHLLEVEPEENADVTVDFILTGKVNDSSTTGWADDGAGGAVFRSGYTEVDTIKLHVGDTVYSASEVFEYDTMSEWLNVAVMQTMNSMIKKEYLTNDLQGIVIFRLKNCTERQYEETKEMVTMMLQQANLIYLEVEDGSKKDALIIHNLKNAPGILDMSERAKNIHEAKYTLDELMDIKLTKDPEDITELQMRILSLALTEAGAKEKLRPRGWRVVPNLIGLTEEEAMVLCEQAGITMKEPVYEYIGWFTEESDLQNPEDYIGKIFYQDAPAGTTVEIGVPFQINIVVTDESKAS